jgi:REP element-mobilizing transposase RayT
VADAYQIKNQTGLYFLTLQVVGWVDIFTRQSYRDIIIDSFVFCRKSKGLKVYAYVIMSNHVHCIVSAPPERSFRTTPPERSFPT